MKAIRITVSLLLAAVMLLSVAACGDDAKNDTTTANAVTTSAPQKSANVKVESDYTVKKIDDLKLALGTSYEDVIGELPSSVKVLEKLEPTGTSTVLFEEKFESEDKVTENWDLYLPADGYEIGDGKVAITKSWTNTKMAVNGERDWMKLDTDEYANYAIKAVVRGTADAVTNNFGIMFRATGVDGSGPDSYSGYYVGIGDADSQICIGKAENNWTRITTYPIDYVPETDFTIEVLVFNDKFVVLWDGEAVVEEDASEHINGTVGIRTYEQLFEVSEFTVRTLGPEDYAKFENGYSDYVDHPVTWSCTDYDPNTKGSYGFIGEVTDLENARIKVKVKLS